MIQKKLLTIFTAFLLVFLSVSFASAAVFGADIISKPVNMTHDVGSFQITFNITYAGTSDSINVSFENSISNLGTATATITGLSNTTLNKGQTKELSATITFESQQSGNIAGKIVAKPSSGAITPVNLDFSVLILDSPSISIPNEITLPRTSNATTLTITNTGNTPLSNLAIFSLEDADFSVSFGTPSKSLINPKETATVTIYSTNAKDLTLGDDNTLTIRVNNSKVDKTTTLTAETSFCEEGNKGKLEITDFNVDNLGLGNDDDWQPLDEIEINVEVKNTGADKISDITVRLMILDDSGYDVTDDFNLDDNEIKLGNLKDGKRDSVIFTIKSLPADLDEGDYQIYVKAFEDGNEDVNCKDSGSDLNKNTYHEISITKEYNNAVILQENEIDLVSAQAGQTVEVSFYVYNIGTNDEDEVLVMLENIELGISGKSHLRRLDIGEKQQVTFNVKIPSNANAKTYNLNVYTYFNYDDGDVLQESSYDDNSYDDLDESYSIPLQVTGGVSIEPVITASLLSTAQIGKEFNIQVSITNPGEAGTFVVSLNNYDSWAELVDITPQVLTIEKGVTKQATITLKPTQSGQQTFNVKLGYNGRTLEQPVQLSVSEKTGFLTGAFAGFGDAGLYIISAIFLILIIIIVILIVKVSSRPRVSEF